MDHYTTLGVAQTATKDAIRTAYKKLALKFHPDKVTDPAHRVASEEAFKAVGNAYEILFDDKKRATYDAHIAHNNAINANNPNNATKRPRTQQNNAPKPAPSASNFYPKPTQSGPNFHQVPIWNGFLWVYQVGTGVNQYWAPWPTSWPTPSPAPTPPPRAQHPPPPPQQAPPPPPPPRPTLAEEASRAAVRAVDQRAQKNAQDAKKHAAEAARCAQSARVFFADAEALEEDLLVALGGDDNAAIAVLVKKLAEAASTARDAAGETLRAWQQVVKVATDAVAGYAEAGRLWEAAAALSYRERGGEGRKEVADCPGACRKAAGEAEKRCQEGRERVEEWEKLGGKGGKWVEEKWKWASELAKNWKMHLPVEG